MSKKKNTLKDLDEFLKQQAAVIVPPTSLSERVPEPGAISEVSDTSPIEEITSPIPTKEEKKEVTFKAAEKKEEEISAEKIIDELTILLQKEGHAFRGTLYDIIIKSLESKPTSPEDKMLINTALYLKSGDKWKDVIRSYWKGKK
jgi:hypothetical protein